MTPQECYSEQRRQLLATNARYAQLLPEEAPDMPPVATLEHRDRYHLLRTAANNHAELVMLAGWGDGSLLEACAADPVLKDKQIHAIIFAGEEQAFAASLRRPLLNHFGDGRLHLSRIADDSEVQVLSTNSYGQHERIPPLAGLDLVSGHPLTDEAEARRRELLPVLRRTLSDRPSYYGNDILDSFSGLYNAARNAPRILASPTLDEIQGCFGDRPIISIGAGPSVARHLDRLRELQDRCVLVACDAVLRGLVENGIEPHFCTPLERVDIIVPKIQGVPLTRTVFAGLPVVLPEIIDAFDGRTLAIWGTDRLYRWLDPGHERSLMTGCSTGVLATSVAANLGTGPVYLVGHDLAVAQDASHWGGANYSGQAWGKAKEKRDSRPGADAGYESRWVPGNSGEPVLSIGWWDRFRNELALLADHLRASGRRMINVNAHDRIGARIHACEAEPLPDPATVDPIGDWPLPPARPQRLRDWQASARRLPEDADAFIAHVGELREDIAASMDRPAPTWDIAGLASRLRTTAAVSEANSEAFAYILRSALFNSTAGYHHQRRTPSHARADWNALQTMHDLCAALSNAVTGLRPKMQEIAEEYADG